MGRMTVVLTPTSTSKLNRILFFVLFCQICFFLITSLICQNPTKGCVGFSWKNCPDFLPFVWQKMFFSGFSEKNSKFVKKISKFFQKIRKKLFDTKKKRDHRGQHNRTRFFRWVLMYSFFFLSYPLITLYPSSIRALKF